MSGQIVGNPQVQQGEGGGIALTWTSNIPDGEVVLYYTVNMYNATTNTLVNSVNLYPNPEPVSEAVWDYSNWDQGDWA